VPKKIAVLIVVGRGYTDMGHDCPGGYFIPGVMAKRSILSYIGSAGAAGTVVILFAMGQS